MRSYFQYTHIEVCRSSLSWKETLSDFNRSSHPEVLLVKDILKICSKFTEETNAEV